MILGTDRSGSIEPALPPPERGFYRPPILVERGAETEAFGRKAAGNRIGLGIRARADNHAVLDPSVRSHCQRNDHVGAFTRLAAFAGIIARADDVAGDLDRLLRHKRRAALAPSCSVASCSAAGTRTACARLRRAAAARDRRSRLGWAGDDDLQLGRNDLFGASFRRGRGGGFDLPRLGRWRWRRRRRRQGYGESGHRSGCRNNHVDPESPHQQGDSGKMKQCHHNQGQGFGPSINANPGVPRPFRQRAAHNSTNTGRPSGFQGDVRVRAVIGQALRVASYRAAQACANRRR